MCGARGGGGVSPGVMDETLLCFDNADDRCCAYKRMAAF